MANFFVFSPMHFLQKYGIILLYEKTCSRLKLLRVTCEVKVLNRLKRVICEQRERLKLPSAPKGAANCYMVPRVTSERRK